MTPEEKREKALMDYVRYTPDGAKNVSRVAIAVASGATLKKICEALDIRIK